MKAKPACVSTQAEMCQLYNNTGLQHMPLSASSQISLSRESPWTESSPYIYISIVSKKPWWSKSQVPPQQGGADGDGAREASQAREKLPKYHRKYPAYP